jgi:hypothetical protein
MLLAQPRSSNRIYQRLFLLLTNFAPALPFLPLTFVFFHQHAY